jgi:hypothetical protein
MPGYVADLQLMLDQGKPFRRLWLGLDQIMLSRATLHCLRASLTEGQDSHCLAFTTAFDIFRRLDERLSAKSAISFLGRKICLFKTTDDDDRRVGCTTPPGRVPG